MSNNNSIENQIRKWRTKQLVSEVEVGGMVVLYELDFSNITEFGEIEILDEEKKICHEPKKNDIIIFHSNIYHSVKPYFGENDRIALVWDAVYTL